MIFFNSNPTATNGTTTNNTNTTLSNQAATANGKSQESILSHANINNAVDSLTLNSSSSNTNTNSNVENQASIQ